MAIMLTRHYDFFFLSDFYISAIVKPDTSFLVVCSNFLLKITQVLVF